MTEGAIPIDCRVFIAEDHPVAHTGLEFLLRRIPGVEITGHARDGAETIRLVAELEPDVLLLDLMLPKKSGLIVLETLEQWQTRPLVIVISGQASGLDYKRAADLGAEGLVSKEDEADDLLLALHVVSKGERYRSPIVHRLLEPLEAAPPGFEEGRNLTTREREILALVAEGHSNAEIGSLLGISFKTAKKHRENVHRKLGISTAVEATRVAARLGLSKL